MRLLREINGPRGGVPELNPTRHRVALATSLLALAVAIPSLASSSPRSPLSDEEVRTQADALLARMTPEEKAGQLSEYFYFSELPVLSKIKEPKPVMPLHDGSNSAFRRVARAV